MIRRALVPAVVACLLVCPPPARAAPGWTWPVEGEVVAGYRNGADPYARGQHRGIDIAAPRGTTVVAAAAGTVRFAGTAGSSGVTVSVRTADGRFDTSYLHLGSLAVARGRRVRAGQALGSVGASGRGSSAGPHLHFGVRRAGSRHDYLDPLELLPPPAVRRPRGQPPAAVPVVAPVRTAPAPAPLATRAPGRVPIPAPSGRRVPVPAGRRVRLPAGRRVRPALPGRTRVAVPADHPSLAPGRLPGGSPAPAGDRAAAGRPAPEPELAPGPGPSGAPAKARSRPGGAAEAGRTAGGPDVGWALACAGLLLAAACAGRSQSRRPARRARPRGVRSLLRALPGR